ncbi:hypothetical protein LSH36_576g01002 [Paralvinella palmiformis]|uniref:Guanylate kinase-like domain-containing protein n=1 Tax=Paralvinella palmiformis TaxID=53620 RepID=A0AAD9MVH7_9ANNE|nr:hypothetical protein LSH36_576g01002 [Paralvinella palmiformis]
METFQPVVISGPSGSGKSTLVKKLMSEYKDCFAFSISHTTRKPRDGEINGRGIKKAVEDIMKTGRICILDIDMQGVKNIKKTDIKARFIFVKPPNLTVLEKRLRDRGTETEDSLKKRLDTAKAELEYADQKGSYDHIIVNDDLEIAYEKLKGILIKDIDALQKQQLRAH